MFYSGLQTGRLGVTKLFVFSLRSLFAWAVLLPSEMISVLSTPFVAEAVSSSAHCYPVLREIISV